MADLRDPAELDLDKIESIEKQSLRWLFLAATDFGFDAWEIFHQSGDNVQDIAEDITREMLDRIGGYQIHRRVFGNVDYRKARYVILPEFAVRQGMFVDSKAEKTSRTATLQMSQVSMEVRQKRGGSERAEVGALPRLATYDGANYLTTMLLAHYEYEDVDRVHHLRHLTVAALPNGLLQERYNPNVHDTIWRAGRNAPTRGEVFRVRVSFEELVNKQPWRVQRVTYNETMRIATANWADVPVTVPAIEGDDHD
ncbi:MAG TPA: SfiI family type II restriction endonuclease [Chthonomonadaceae bacterium]|nr:SfiI family type II restriction endonuclease [Chthonomonadaceae bacterium]